MPRPMSAEREREYAELHAFLDFMSTHVSCTDPADPVHPTNVGKTILAVYGKSKALDGLKQAVNDTMEMLSDRPPEYVQLLDAALREKSIITFSEARRRYGSSYKRILKRGKIKNDTEYRLIAGLLADSSSQATVAERAQLENFASCYLGDA